MWRGKVRIKPENGGSVMFGPFGEKPGIRCSRRRGPRRAPAQKVHRKSLPAFTEGILLVLTRKSGAEALIDGFIRVTVMSVGTTRTRCASASMPRPSLSSVVRKYRNYREFAENSACRTLPCLAAYFAALNCVKSFDSVRSMSADRPQFDRVEARQPARRRRHPVSWGRSCPGALRTG